MPFRRRYRMGRFRRRFGGIRKARYHIRGGLIGRRVRKWQRHKRKNRIGPELKRYTVSHGVQENNAEGVVLALTTGIDQGLGGGGDSGEADTSQPLRVGRTVNAKYLLLRGNINDATGADNVGGTVPRRYRVIVFRDRRYQVTVDGSSVVPTVVDLLQFGTVATRAFQSPLNAESAGRFQIYWDKIYTFNPALADLTTTQAGPTEELTQSVMRGITFKKYFKLKSVLRWSGTTGTAGASNFQNNHFFLAFIPEVTLTGELTMMSTLGFTDA